MLLPVWAVARMTALAHLHTCTLQNCRGLHRHLFDVMLPLLCRRRGTSDRAAVPLFSTYHHCQVYCRQVRVSMAAVPHRRRVQRAQLQLHRGDGCSLLAGHCPCSCTAAGQGCAALRMSHCSCAALNSWFVCDIAQMQMHRMLLLRGA